MEIQRKFFLAGSIFGVVAVVLGAMGAHALKEILDTDALASFETGVRYQLYHALLLLFLGLENQIKNKTKRIIFYLLVVGIVFFSFSIYLLSTNSFTEFDFKKIAFITPVGGSMLIIAWLIMLVSFFKKSENKIVK